MAIFIFSYFDYYECSKYGIRKKAEESGRRDSGKRETKVEIMTDFIKLNDEVPVCVAATVYDLQVLKLQISDNMSAYCASDIQHLKEVSSDHQNFIIKTLDARKICCS